VLRGTLLTVGNSTAGALLDQARVVGGLLAFVAGALHEVAEVAFALLRNANQAFTVSVGLVVDGGQSLAGVVPDPQRHIRGADGDGMSTARLRMLAGNPCPGWLPRQLSARQLRADPCSGAGTPESP